MELVVARAGAVNLFRFQVRLRSQGRIKPRSIGFYARGWDTLVIETRTELITWATRSQLDRVLSWADGILRLLGGLRDALLLILHPLIVRPDLVSLDSKLSQKKTCGKKLGGKVTYG